MGTRLFVGNLSYNVNEQELKEAFQTEQIEVRSVRIAMDRDTGRPRGFAFVETETEAGAKDAIAKLGGRLIAGRAIIIEEAQARTGPGGPRPGGPRPGGGPGGPPRPGAGPGGPGGFRPGGFSGPRPGGPPPMGGPGGPPRSFGPPRPPGPDNRGPDRPKAEARRERPEKKRSTRPKPEERERGNWHWSGILDDD